jgi:hypothetical protein
MRPSGVFTVYGQFRINFLRVTLHTQAEGRSAQRFSEFPFHVLPFRTLRDRYPVEDLAEAFAEGITTGHPSMPQFQLDPAQINDLIAYLNSIQS